MDGNDGSEGGAREGVNVWIITAFHIQHSLSRKYFQTSVYGAV